MDVVLLTKKLIEIESVTNNELQMAYFLRDWFTDRKWEVVTLQPVISNVEINFPSKSRINVYAQYRRARTEGHDRIFSFFF